MFQMKGQDQTPEINPNEVEVSNVPDKEFKLMVTMMLTELRRVIDEHNENFNRDRKYN